MHDNLVRVIEEIDFLAAERTHLEIVGPHFTIAHRRPSSNQLHSDSRCFPGEEVVYVALLLREKQYCLHLSPSSLLLFNLLALRRIAMSAQQITAEISRRAFYCVYYGISACAHGQRIRLQSRSLKVLVPRIRNAMQTTFYEAGLNLEARSVLRSEASDDARRVFYRLKASCEVIHLS